MKTERRTPKRLLAIIAAGMAFASLVVWFGLRHNHLQPQETDLRLVPETALGNYVAETPLEIQSSGEALITRTNIRRLEGWVLDADTGKPIHDFRITAGRHPRAQLFYPDYPGAFEFTNSTGAFTLDVTEPESNSIKAEAEDYAEEILMFPNPEAGVMKIILHLKPSPGLRGIVVRLDGSPVFGADVALRSVQEGKSALLKDGRLITYPHDNKLFKTDPNGQFILPEPPKSCATVIAASEEGIGFASVQELRRSGRIFIENYGRIEGTITFLGKPVGGQRLALSIPEKVERKPRVLQGINPASNDASRDESECPVTLEWATIRTSSDEQGRFTFETIPPGEVSIVRLIKNSSNPTGNSHKTEVIVESARTTHVHFGDSGAVIRGRAVFETPTAETEKLIYSAILSTQKPEQGDSKTPNKATEQFQLDQWVKQVKMFEANMVADSTFTFDSVPPGTYSLYVLAKNVSLVEFPPIARGHTTVIVPANPDPLTPMNIGDVILKPVPKSDTKMDEVFRFRDNRTTPSRYFEYRR